MADNPQDGVDRTSPARPRSLLDQRGRRRVLDERIDIDDWAGGLPQEETAQVPAVRIGRRWISTLWLVPIGVAGLIVAVALAQQLRHYGWMQSFIAAYPGASTSFAPAVDSGFPAWLRWHHLFNIVFMMFIIRAGLQILADHPRLYLNSGCRPGTAWLRMRGPVPADRMDEDDPAHRWTAKDDSVALPKWLGIPGIRHSIGLARWWHFSFDLLWLVNGIVFYVLLFASGQWRRIVPQSWDVFPNAVSTAVQYASLDFPANEGFTNYNGLQITAYFTTVFVAAPLAFVSGLLQAPSIAARFGFGRGLLNRQVARSIHFAILLWMIFFIAVHTVMVFMTGLVGNLSHIVFGTDTQSYWAVVIYLAAMVIIGILWLIASPITLRYPRVVQLTGRWLVGWIKWLMEWTHPNATYSEKDISPFLWANGTLPDSDHYRHLQATNWSEYSLRLEGLVENPVTISYDELGFKQVKWIEAVEFVDSFAHLGLGQGGYNEDHEFYGYRMPI